MTAINLPNEVYTHLKTMQKANKIYFIKKWKDGGKDELSSVINQYFIRQNNYESQNGMYVILGLDGSGLYKTDLHRMMTVGQGVDSEDVKSIESFFVDYANQAFDIVLKRYGFLHCQIYVIWFATPAMVTEMKNAKKLLFLDENFEQSKNLNAEIAENKEVKPLQALETEKKAKANESKIKIGIPSRSNVRVVGKSTKINKPVTTKTEKPLEIEKSDDNPKVMSLLLAIHNQELSRQEIMAKLEIPEESRKFYNEHYYKPAEKLGFVEKTLKDKPNSKFQKYRLTELGKEKLATFEKTSKSLH